MAARFIPSADLRITVRSLYFFGFLGVIIDGYHIELKTIPVFSLENPGINLSGLFGFLVAYFSISTIVKYVYELAEFEDAYAKEGQEELAGQAEEANSYTVRSPSTQAVFNNLQARRLRLGNVMVAVYPFNMLLDLALPCVFLAYCNYRLFYQAIDFSLALYRHL